MNSRGMLGTPNANSKMMERYQKVMRIGKGTFGEAWLVTSSCSGRKYVVKEVRVADMTAAEITKANTEAHILARCKHNNIVRYKEVFFSSSPSLLCLVMEYADGGDLSIRVKEAREKDELIAETVILNWFVQVIFAVQYLHYNDILHRDLKCQNIFLTKNDLVKVGDFGIARVLTSREDLATTAIGTPFYLSPEICRRAPYNHKSDMWALGCVLYEICSLSHPFSGDTFPDLVLRILRGAYRQLPAQYSGFVRDLVAVLLRTDPTRRPSADQVLMVPMLRPYVSGYLKEQDEVIVNASTFQKTKISEQSPDNYTAEPQTQTKGTNLREAILKRLPFQRPRASSDSCVDASSNRPGINVQSPSKSVEKPNVPSSEVRKPKRDPGYFSDETPETIPRISHKDSPAMTPSDSIGASPVLERAVSKIGPSSSSTAEYGSSSSLQVNPHMMCFTGTLDSNIGTKTSNSSSVHLSSTSSSSSNTRNQSSMSSCLSCCSRLSTEMTGDKKSPMIHVKLYSSASSDESSDGNTTAGSRRYSHVLCHKVPLSSLSCCSECRTEKDGDLAPCNCVCSEQFEGGNSSQLDKKSVDSSIQTSCSCAEEVSCTCTKGSQITCEVDLVFEGENVKNVPMKNGIMEVDISCL